MTWRVILQRSYATWEERDHPDEDRRIALLEWFASLVDTGPPDDSLPVPFQPSADSIAFKVSTVAGLIENDDERMAVSTPVSAAHPTSRLTSKPATRRDEPSRGTWRVANGQHSAEPSGTLSPPSPTATAGTCGLSPIANKRCQRLRLAAEHASSSGSSVSSLTSGAAFAPPQLTRT